MMEQVLPGWVAVAEMTTDPADVDLFPEEARAVRNAVDKRRREFATGRACARRALGKLGVPPTAVAHGRRGEPIWPAGIVGSITHCESFRACAVASTRRARSIGIDAEPNQPLPPSITDQIVFGAERESLGQVGRACVDRLVFTAKEAVYKAWYPLARRWLGFEDVRLVAGAGERTFRARLLVSGPDLGGAPLREFRGRWSVGDGLICAAVIVPTADGPAPDRW